ncbi:MAG: amino acid racemase [Pseudomonadota bacterium]
MRRPIGILGGMGPEATLLLQKKLIDAVPAQDDKDHIPLLIDMNPQVPSRIAHLIEGKGEDPGPILAAMAQRLEVAGAVALAMPCNTAHHYAQTITNVAALPLLNMVELAADRAAEMLRPGEKVGLLASPAVRLTKLFDRALEARGLAAVWPDDEDATLSAIRDIKENGPTQAARDTLHTASEDTLAKGAKLQLVACSEFSMIADSVSAEGPALDTLDILVEAIVAVSNDTGT